MQGFRFARRQGYELLDIPRASPAAAFLVNPQSCRKQVGAQEAVTTQFPDIRFGDPFAETDVHGGSSLPVVGARGPQYFIQ